MNHSHRKAASVAGTSPIVSTKRTRVSSEGKSADADAVLAAKQAERDRKAAEKAAKKTEREKIAADKKAAKLAGAAPSA
ncbi:MAG: hypothetical protein ACREJD_05795 [Phycisphaerales bacterium]